MTSTFPRARPFARATRDAWASAFSGEMWGSSPDAEEGDGRRNGPRPGGGLVILLGVIFTPWILFIVAPGFSGEVRDLTIQIVRIMFPGIGLLVVSAWCLGILNSHRKFFISYVAPVFMNVAMIAVLLIFGGRLSDSSLAIAAAWGTVIGAALQLGVQVPFVVRYSKHIRFAVSTTLEPVREILRNFGPVVVGRGVVQLSAYLDSLLARASRAASPRSCPPPPERTIRCLRRPGIGSGIALRSAIVYGCSGVCRTCSAGPCSTIWPAYMTSTVSAT